MSITIFPYLVNRESKLESVTEEEFQGIENFKHRVEQLHSTKKKDMMPPLSQTSYEDGRVVSYENNVPDIDYVIAISTRYRLLFAEKEPTRFEKIVNIVRRRATDEWAQNYIDNIRLCYLKSLEADDISNNLGLVVENRKMISLWFNSEFFHTDSDKRKILSNINESIGEAGSLFHLYVAIRRCLADVDRLYTVLHKFHREHSYIYTPNHHFRKAGAIK